MIQNEVVLILKNILAWMNAPNPSASQVEVAAMFLASVNVMIKNNVVQADLTFHTVEAEMKTFLNSPKFLEIMKGELPSVKNELCDIHTRFLKTQIKEIKPM